MSKKAFSYLRKKRVVPMPSLTSLRKYQREHGIVIHHNPNKSGSNLKGSSKKKPKKSLMPTVMHGTKNLAGSSKMMQAINIPTSAVISNTYDGQQIQIVNTSGTTIGTVQGVLAPQQPLQTIQLQVVDPTPPPSKGITRVKAVGKFCFFKRDSFDNFIIIIDKEKYSTKKEYKLIIIQKLF